ncbi:unnamed protein product [Staurois parvus]|uniref:Uncharacterized protein n=1 Tax=Staurois parvus TaxID=386267 RepID=A0ABN9D6M3_9NEOB|nr:unnamed protein product [Staurois parvus]
MALGRKGLTCEEIKGLTVCCFTVSCVALHGSPIQSHIKQCAGADRGENCFVYLQFSPSICNALRSLGVGE